MHNYYYFWNLSIVYKYTYNRLPVHFDDIHWCLYIFRHIGNLSWADHYLVHDIELLLICRNKKVYLGRCQGAVRCMRSEVIHVIWHFCRHTIHAQQQSRVYVYVHCQWYGCACLPQSNSNWNSHFRHFKFSTNTFMNFTFLLSFYFYLLVSLNFMFINMVKTASNVNFCKAAVARNIATYLQTTACSCDAATIASMKFLLQVVKHSLNIQPYFFAQIQNNFL